MPDQSEKYNKIEVTPELIEKYMRGQLDGKTMHAIEKQALDDPFLAEALEGFSARDPGQSVHLAALKKRLSEKLEATEKRPEKKAFLIRYRNFQIAAAAVLLLLIGAGIFFYAGKRPSIVHTVAHNQPPRVDLPEKVLPDLPKDTSERLAEIPGKDSNVSQEVAVNIPGKRIPASPAEKRVLVQKKKEVSLTHQRPENSPDTLQVAAWDAQGKERVTGTVEVIHHPALAASAARAMSSSVINKNKKISLQGDSVLLAGRISDAEAHRPLAGVTVRVPGTTMGTVTDSAGEFRLPVAVKPESLRLAFLSYQSREIAVNNPSRAINVSLRPSHQALNEAVVVGYSTKKPRALKNAASPVGGITVFRQYVKDSLHYPAEARRENIEGVVKLSFIVMPDSSLEHIKVVSSLGYGCDSEAIRLLREGPRWIPARGGRASEQTVRVRFSMPGTEK